MSGILNTAKFIPSRTVHLARHGQTALNKEKRIRGWSDVGLDETGFEQAYALGKRLKNKGLDMIVCSDLTRTIQTATCISKESGIPLVATTMALRPLNVGDYTAKPQDEVLEVIREYMLEKPEENLPGGESLDSFKYRCIMGIISFMNEYPDKNILFVAHHRNDRLLRAWVEAGCPDDLELDTDHFFVKGIEPGTVDEFTIESCYLI